MNKFGTIMACLFLVLMSWSTAWAMDFSRMTNQELAELRGAITNAPAAEQAAYRQEWEKRLARMTEEEKSLFLSPGQPKTGEGEASQKPYIPGRGYESQGVGTVIYGGFGAPAEGVKGQGK
ncbi:MAG: hypothetical protein ACYCYR_03710 [Desulfobulbaceae bacterium]|jgi:hypothetical protein